MNEIFRIQVSTTTACFEDNKSMSLFLTHFLRRYLWSLVHMRMLFVISFFVLYDIEKTITWNWKKKKKLPFRSVLNKAVILDFFLIHSADSFHFQSTFDSIQSKKSEINRISQWIFKINSLRFFISWYLLWVWSDN